MCTSGYHENSLRRVPVLYMQDGKNLFFPEEAFQGRHLRVGDALHLLDTMNAVDRAVVVGPAGAVVAFAHALAMARLEAREGLRLPRGGPEHLDRQDGLLPVEVDEGFSWLGVQISP